MNKIIFFGGKGGVGKTTCSSAFGVHSAKKGDKTLLISTDPAHSISDVFQKSIGREIVKLRDNLYGLEIDSDYESKKYINNIRKNLKNVVSPIIVEEINRQLDAAVVSPGTQESALFDKMIEIIIEKNEEFDRIVFDTAPTGHTIRLMSLPELLGGWIESLMVKRRKALKIRQMAREWERGKKDVIEKDPIMKILNKRKMNFEKAREIMINEEQLSFIFVMNAEKLPIQETKKAINILKKYNMNINYIVVNRILPEVTNDDFWKSKKELERKYLKEIEDTFKDKKIIKLPLLQKDIGVGNIDVMANYFDKVL